MLTPRKFYSLVISVFLVVFLVEKNSSIKSASYASCGSCDLSCLTDFCKTHECPFPWPTFPPICPTHTPAPEPTPTAVIPTNTPVPETPTPTSVLPTNTPPPSQPTLPPPTATPGPGGPTNTPGPRPDHNTCYYQCNGDYDCHDGQECQDVGGGVKKCRNPSCVEEEDCECAGIAATPVPAGGMVLGKTISLTPTPQYGEVLGLASTGQSLASPDLVGAASIIGRLMVIAGCFLLL